MFVFCFLFIWVGFFVNIRLIGSDNALVSWSEAVGSLPDREEVVMLDILKEPCEDIKFHFMKIMTALLHIFLRIKCKCTYVVNQDHRYCRYFL